MQLFRKQSIGLRRRFQAWQIPAVLRLLQEQRDAAMLQLRERHAERRFNERQRERLQRPVPLLPT